MKHTNKQRVLIGRLATLAAAACGVAVGRFLGCALALSLAQGWLGQYAALVVEQGDESSKEARSVLAVLQNSPYSFCSDAEISYLRELAFRSEYLKDAGRIEGGKIDCSASAGRATRSIGEFRAELPQRDGTIAYRNLVPVGDAKLKWAGLQLGSAFVAFSAQMPGRLGPIPMDFRETAKDTAISRSGLPGGGVPQADGSLMSSDGQVRLGDTLYVTRCSTHYFDCATAFTSVPEALQGEVSWVNGGMMLGGAAGALIGVAFSLIYRRSRNMEQQLRRAIARDKLQLAYQPIVNLSTGRIVGAEALARWTNEEGAEVSPDVFVKIAEEHGFVGAITRLMIGRSLQAFGDTLRTHPGFRLSVNVAAADLADPGFLPMLDGSLKRARVQPKSLVIEITESSTANRVEAMETIRALRRRGHSIHIDDFGTGYSSLSYLLYLSVDTIKIDKAFTRAIGTESVSVAILPQILAMAESLKLGVVVEGIETGQQADYFSTTGQLIHGQGWLYGHPLTAEEFLGVLDEDWSKRLLPVNSVGVRSAGQGAVRIAGVYPLRIDTPRTA
jgi:sensor c-di-GMP phosphodiesterase-like protein